MRWKSLLCTTAVLQKVVEDRKILEEGIGYAATPKISAMNFTCSLMAPFSTPVPTTEGTSATDRLYFFNLSFLQHLHNFVSFNCLPCGVE